MTSQSFDPNHGKRAKLFGAWMFLLVSLFLIWAGWHWPAVEHGTFAAGLARGQILQVTPSSGHRFDVLLGYKDSSGTPQSNLEQWQHGKFQVGEKVWVDYIDGSPERAYMDPSMPMMIAMSMAPGLLGVAIGLWLLVHTLHRYAQRRRALSEWTRMDVRDPRIQIKSLNLGTRFGGQLPPTWRLHGRVLDPSGHWRDIYSDWGGSARVPELGTDSVLKVLVDPRHPRRYWLPLPISGSV
jgi:hypothetical protein